MNKGKRLTGRVGGESESLSSGASGHRSVADEVGSNDGSDNQVVGQDCSESGRVESCRDGGDSGEGGLRRGEQGSSDSVVNGSGEVGSSDSGDQRGESSSGSGSRDRDRDTAMKGESVQRRRMCLDMNWN